MGNLAPWGVTSDFYNNPDYNPAFDNLYTIEIFSPADESLKDYIKLQASQVQFGTDSLSLERHSVTKKFHIKDNSFVWTDELTITWRENDSWKVKKFHEKWLANFYNKDIDAYISYPSKEAAEKALYKTFRITLPSYETGKKEIITFERVLPSNAGALSFKWSQNPQAVEHTMKYYVENWYWEKPGSGSTPAPITPSTSPNNSMVQFG